MLTSTATLGVALSSLLTGATARPQFLQARQQSYASQINGTRISTAPVALDVSINGGGRNATAPYLYGWMFEDINVRATLHANDRYTDTVNSIQGMAAYMQKWLRTGLSRAQSQA